MNNGTIYSSKTDMWATPIELFKMLDMEFHFTLDPCCTHENAKCHKHYTKEEDGLIQDWSGETVFCNPPYGRELKKWVKKCAEESVKPGTTVVMLVPSRTDTEWFQKYVYRHAELRFIRGRIKFGDGKNHTPFASMIVIFNTNIQ